MPSSLPSSFPSAGPSVVPSVKPSSLPTAFPSSLPSSLPTIIPSSLPSDFPSITPFASPSSFPSSSPSLGVYFQYQYSWFYPLRFKDKEEFINRLIRIFTEKLVAGSVECYDNELECNNGYEIQFYVGTYCGSYSIIVDVEQLEYPSCSDIGEDDDVSKCVLVITSITLSPKFLMTETQAVDVQQTIMEKLDEAVENGCIESLLDYGHSFTPTSSPISLPTTTSGPTIGSIFVDYQYSWFYPKTYKEETINSLIRVFTEKVLQVYNCLWI